MRASTKCRSPSQAANWKDLNAREWVYLAPLAVLVLYLGLMPTLALKTINPSVVHLLNQYETRKTLHLESSLQPEPPAHVVQLPATRGTDQ